MFNINFDYLLWKMKKKYLTIMQLTLLQFQ